MRICFDSFGKSVKSKKLKDDLFNKPEGNYESNID